MRRPTVSSGREGHEGENASIKGRRRQTDSAALSSASFRQQRHFYMTNMIRTVLATILLAAAVVEAQYGYAKPCPPEVRYVTKTQSVPQYVTVTRYQTQTQYQTAYTTQYVTETQAVPHYVTQTQAVPHYVTETVPQYVTTTVQQKEYVTVDQYCKPSGGYGYHG
ncbi:uncharacterized protein [Penaeus vannamei]|uniref:uncharacterized protein n=1 Tax=Penaeus vannamei TaxID=6689 RepID=UPI00387F7C85